ncbi:MAG: succinylarginine dihydrolase [Pseudohongiellaceae bacterium]|jgi:succinylarginine dihydrolase
MSIFEVNFDGLVGPSHNFAGLAFGNLAASSHADQVASPRAAALQGLAKMKALSDLGMKQGVLLPHERPHMRTLHRMGFRGANDAETIALVAKQSPELFKQCVSGSAMWVANAATVSPFADTQDSKTHFTPANLSSMFHRSIESEVTGRQLAAIFSSKDFVHHAPLPAGQCYSDEGAANHTRLCSNYDDPGLELFVYGAPGVAANNATAVVQIERGPQKFPARQTLASCQALMRIHGLDPSRTVLAQQHPDAIDAGVFHNDVIAVGNRDLLFYHQLAFADNKAVRDQLQQRFTNTGANSELSFIEVANNEVSLADAVSSYLFNTQLISMPDRSGMTVIAPMECQENESVYRYLQALDSEHAAIDSVIYFDLKQSMNNGGGPACLRLRVVLAQNQIDELGARVMLDDNLYEELQQWIKKHYRDRLAPADLVDPQLLVECREALDELTVIVEVGSLYDFQRD